MKNDYIVNIVRKKELHFREAVSFRDIQEQFSLEYPYLKLDFLKSVTVMPGKQIKTEKVCADDQISSYYRDLTRGDVTIPIDKKITQVISEMENLLCLKVIVLRRSGNVWIETMLTKDWTLEQQNREGEYLSFH